MYQFFKSPQIENIYDLFARCCIYILELAAKGEFHLPTEGSAQRNDIRDAVDAYVANQEIEGKRNALLILLEQLFMICEGGCTQEQAFDIAEAIDELIELEEPVSNITNSNAYFVRYSSLNLNYSDSIRILPVLNDTFMSRSQSKFSEVSSSGHQYSMLRDAKASNDSILDSYFANYIVIEKGTIEKFPVNIFRVRNDSGLGRYYAGKNNVKLTLIPFTQVSLDKIQNIKYEGNFFSCEGMKPEQEERLMNKQKALFELMEKDNTSDFIIFPEMLFTERMVQHSIECHERPELIVNGSIWKEGYNYSTLCLCGNEIYKHYKRCPYIAKRIEQSENGKDKVEKRYQEKLCPLGNIEKSYNILEAGSFGRIAVGICKDLDDINMVWLWKLLKVNLLLVPAFSSSTDLESSAEALVSLNNMIVVLCNACSAVSNLDDGKKFTKTDKQIGFIALPGKRKSTRTAVMEYYYKKEACNNCEAVCMGHKAVINFNKKRTISESGVKTFDLKWMG